MNILSLIPGFSFFRLGVAAVIIAVAVGAAWKWRHGGVVQGRAEIQAQWDADVSTRLAAQLAQEQANRAKETELNATIVKQRANYAKDIERRNATALLVAGQLRDFQALASQPRPAGQDTASARVFDDARTTVISECTNALAEVDKDSQRRSDKVTGLQIYVSEVCQR